MKKYLSFLLALVMLVSLAPVYANGEKAEDEAGKKLKEWGALKGSKDGNLMKDEGLKREDAVLILIRMMGKEEEAEATPTLPSFKDISDKYYHPYIAFAQAQGWTEGRNKDEFGYNQLVSADEFSALMLRALGYEYKGKEYAKVGEKAKELGLLTNANVKGAKFRRGSAFVIMLNTLNQPKKEGGDKLSQILGYEQKPKPIVFRMEHTSRGLREIILEFNKPIHPSTAKNFKLMGEKHEVDIKDISVFDENKKLSILLEKPAKNDDKFTLSIQDIKTEDLKESFKGDVEVIMFDNERPVISEVTALGPKLLLVKVTEALNIEPKPSFSTHSEVLVDGKQQSVRIEYAGRDELMIELYTALKKGSHEVEISGFRDYAGYTVEVATMSIDVEEDKKEPELVKAELLSSDKLKLVFNEPLYDKGEVRVNDSQIANASLHLDKNDRRVIYVDLVRPIRTKVALITYKNQRDVMKNRIKDSMTFKLELEDDKTAPTVVRAAVDKIDFIVIFSEAMNKKAGSYTIKQENKTIKKVSAMDAAAWLEDDKLKIDISNLSGDINKPYTMILEGFKDAGINQLELAKYETSFQAVDTKQPTAEEAYRIVEYYDKDKRTFKEITITFSEEMDKATLEDARNYTFKSYYDGKASRTVRGDQADFSYVADKDAKSVTIRVLEPKAWIDGVIELTGQKDKAGNYLLTKQVAKYSGESNKLVKAMVTGTVGEAKIEVEFSNPIEILGEDALVLRDEAGRELSLSLVSHEGKKAVFQAEGSAFTMDNDAKTLDGKSLTLKVAEASSAVDVYGTTLAKNASIALVDKLAPTVDIASIEVLSNRKISVVFSEPMDKAGFILKLLKAEGGVATYTENGEEKVNSVKYSDESALSGEYKHRKIVFQTAGAMTKGSYKLVLGQAKDRSENFLNDGYELELDFFMNK